MNWVLSHTVQGAQVLSMYSEQLAIVWESDRIQGVVLQAAHHSK